MGGDVALPYVVANIGVRIHVERAEEDETVIETEFGRTDFEGAFVIDVGLSLGLAILSVHDGTQMPLTDVVGRIASVAKHIAESVGV